MQPNATVAILHRSGARDAYGNLIADTGGETSVAALFAPEADTEINQPGRRGVVRSGTVYILESATVDHNDQVRVDGVVFEVNGMPQTWTAPGETLRGIVVQVRRTEG